MTLSLTLFGVGAAFALFGLLVGLASPGHGSKAKTAHSMSAAMMVLVAAGAVTMAVSLAVHLM